MNKKRGPGRPRKVGRPKKHRLTPKMRAAILAIVEDGKSRAEAANLAGLTDDAVRKGMKDNPAARGGDEPADDLLFDRASFKDALPALSEYRVSRVLFAEYADLRHYIEALREDKTEQNVASLARHRKVSEAEALVVARKLRDTGFFEERTPSGEMTFWVPFVYRPYLQMSQGKVDQISSPELPLGNPTTRQA